MKIKVKGIGQNIDKRTIKKTWTSGNSNKSKGKIIVDQDILKYLIYFIKS